MKTTFDVIVIGGGHAGIEAAHAAAGMGSQTLLITLSKETIGLMPCNPSIGGLGKGHIVYEISALGGLMPKLCSTTYLQARMLNTSKGPAVQGLRLQIDKYAYKDAAQKTLSHLPHLTIHEGMITHFLVDISPEQKKMRGVKTEAGDTFYAPYVVVTSGTFLNGLVHIGLENHAAGRYGEPAVESLSGSIEEVMGIKLGRLKTGTPPRLLKTSLNYALLETQEPQHIPYLFEFDEMVVEEKEPVYIAHTNPKTHTIIAHNLHQSGMYSGNIKGIGPRYCPSIEDKISRFADKTSHHVFVEPEGGDSNEVYPSGLSTSLPLDIQNDYIHTIEGFENAVITKAGYAVEYDFVQPHYLNHTLETKTVSGLFFAGQVNGTTGYEEAAGQGIIAGINASLRAQNKPPFILDRNQSYIGIMIDDLITLGVDEPYRMFTSRAERRLHLRQDNVFSRLSQHGYNLGLIDNNLFARIQQEQQLVTIICEMAFKRRSSPLYQAFQVLDFSREQQEKARTIVDQALKDTPLANVPIHSRALLSIHAEIRYEGYLEKERREIEKMRKYQNIAIPVDFDYKALPGLSVELQQKLIRHKPTSLAAAQQIPGITPAAISLLLFHLLKRTGHR